MEHKEGPRASCSKAFLGAWGRLARPGGWCWWGLSPKTLRRLEYGEDWPSLRALATVAEHLGADLVLAPVFADWRPMPWQRAPGAARPGHA